MMEWFSKGVYLYLNSMLSNANPMKFVLKLGFMTTQMSEDLTLGTVFELFVLEIIPITRIFHNINLN